jgi:hypothetical protein
MQVLLESELAPDSILPAQLDDAPFRGARILPEKRLQVAVLADAVLTFHRWAGGDRARARRLFTEVEAWFASDEAGGPFTFITICDSLDFDPTYIRRGLRNWRSFVEATAKPPRSLHPDDNGTRHHVALPRLRRVA